MNILPKKSWHVRNKDNVARVRRDEAKALEEEQECARRKALAEQEARIRILREKAKLSQEQKREAQWDLPQEPAAIHEDSDQDDNAEATQQYVPLNTAFPTDQHINLFEDFEKKKKAQGSNKDYEKEKKKLQEDYEKKIGYLTYLGQSASEMTKEKPWYEKVPAQADTGARVTYSQYETLQAADPLLSMKGYLDKKKLIEHSFYNTDSTSPTTVLPKRKHTTSAVVSEKLSRNELDTAGQSEVHSKNHKHKKSKKSKKHKRAKYQSPTPEPETFNKPSMEELRVARMAREAAERQRSLDLVAKYKGFSSPARSVIDERNLTYNTVYGHQSVIGKR